jgi:hypothetical protein
MSNFSAWRSDLAFWLLWALYSQHKYTQICTHIYITEKKSFLQKKKSSLWAKFLKGTDSRKQDIDYGNSCSLHIPKLHDRLPDQESETHYLRDCQQTLRRYRDTIDETGKMAHVVSFWANFLSKETRGEGLKEAVAHKGSPEHANRQSRVYLKLRCGQGCQVTSGAKPRVCDSACHSHVSKNHRAHPKDNSCNHY